MTKNPKLIQYDMVVDALNILEDFSTQLVVVDHEDKGVLHLHDILKEGI
jgi:arabinose-5-phosphate isomerase